MYPLTAEQLKSACEGLGLRRSDIAEIFHYSWTQVNAWCLGLAPVPQAVSIILTVWLHPLCPPELKPHRGVPYLLGTNDENYSISKRKNGRVRRAGLSPVSSLPPARS